MSQACGPVTCPFPPGWPGISPHGMSVYLSLCWEGQSAGGEGRLFPATASSEGLCSQAQSEGACGGSSRSTA